MSDAIKVALRELIQTIFEIVTGLGGEGEKVAKLRRAAETLASEKASDQAIDRALGALKHE